MDWYLASVARMQQERERAAPFRVGAAVWCLGVADLGLCGLWWVVRLCA